MKRTRIVAAITARAYGAALRNRRIGGDHCAFLLRVPPRSLAGPIMATRLVHLSLGEWATHPFGISG